MNKGNSVAARLPGADSPVGLTAARPADLVRQGNRRRRPGKDAKTGKAGPNDRIVMGAIGTGTNRTRRTGNQPLHGERGVAIMQDAMRADRRADGRRLRRRSAQRRVRAEPRRTAQRGGSRDCALVRRLPPTARRTATSTPSPSARRTTGTP